MLTIFIILARQPRDVNPSYQGKIRELLKPFLESTSEFCMKTFVDTIEAYEDSKNLFVDKVKPQVKASLSKGNPGKTPYGKGYDRSEKPAPDQQTIQRLKTNAQNKTKKWEVTAWKTHQNDCTTATFGTNSNRICFWCVETECLRSRGEAYRNKGPEFQLKPGAKYAEWREKMDKDTKDMCTNFATLNSRLPGGAKVSKAVLNVQQPT